MLRLLEGAQATVTGETTQTGGRIKRIQRYVGDETFCMTYGDGLADVNITEAVRFHAAQKRLATVTAVTPPGRFGVLTLDEHRIVGFREKPPGDGARINGGYFVLSPAVFDYIAGDG